MTAKKQTNNKRFINFIIIILLFLMLVDGLPEINRFHRNLKGQIDIVVDKLGIWQGSWTLFAPEVDKRNSHIIAIIEYETGELVNWRSPDWNDMSITQRFTNFRHMEYYDSIQFNDNKAAWEALADYLAKQHAQDGKTVVDIELKLSYYVIPHPDAREDLKKHSLIPKVSPFYKKAYEVEDK